MFDPADSVDLRTGPEINAGLLALLPLVGLWQGSGRGLQPGDGAEFQFVQQVSFSHDGRPFLNFDSRAWLVDEAGALIRPAFREVGFWRPGPGPDDVEVVLALVTGIAETLAGTAGDAQWELHSTALIKTVGAKAIIGERRFYAIVAPADDQALMGERLVWAQELSLREGEFVAHLNGSLQRVATLQRLFPKM